MSPYKLLSTSLNKAIYVIAAAVLLSVSLVAVASAERIGVGISTGRIDLNTQLRPGMTYNLPKIAVFNNGSATTTYEMSVQFNEKQPQLKPAASWIKFDPQHFTIKPGKARQVEITLRASSSARPGTYFAYLEAHPLKKDKSGKTAINIAAATKLTFKVAPANIWQKLYYFLLDLWNKYKQFIIPALVLIISAIVITLSRSKFKIEVSSKKKSKSSSPIQNYRVTYRKKPDSKE
jgi:hypothetical protein